MGADLHTHTDASQDSPLSFADRVALAAEHDLDAVAITDHMAVNDELTARETTIDGVTVIAGVELYCTTADVRIDILGYFVDPAPMRDWTAEHAAAADERLTGATAIEWIHEAGGAAVLAHPGRYDADLSGLVATLVEDGLDGIEIAYPYDEYTFISSDTPEMPMTPVAEIEALATEHGLLQTGGSDCHGGEKTYMGVVSVDTDRVEQLRAASEQYR